MQSVYHQNRRKMGNLRSALACTSMCASTSTSFDRWPDSPNGQRCEAFLSRKNGPWSARSPAFRRRTGNKDRINAVLRTTKCFTAETTAPIQLGLHCGQLLQRIGQRAKSRSEAGGSCGPFVRRQVNYWELWYLGYFLNPEPATR